MSGYRALRFTLACFCDLDKVLGGADVEAMFEDREAINEIQKLVIDGMVYGCQMKTAPASRSYVAAETAKFTTESYY